MPIMPLAVDRPMVPTPTGHKYPAGSKALVVYPGSDGPTPETMSSNGWYVEWRSHTEICSPGDVPTGTVYAVVIERGLSDTERRDVRAQLQRALGETAVRSASTMRVAIDMVTNMSGRFQLPPPTAKPEFKPDPAPPATPAPPLAPAAATPAAEPVGPAADAMHMRIQEFTARHMDPAATSVTDESVRLAALSGGRFKASSICNELYGKLTNCRGRKPGAPRRPDSGKPAPPAPDPIPTPTPAKGGDGLQAKARKALLDIVARANGLAEAASALQALLEQSDGQLQASAEENARLAARVTSLEQALLKIQASISQHG